MPSEWHEKKTKKHEKESKMQKSLPVKVPFNFVTLHLNFHSRYYFSPRNVWWLRLAQPLVSITIHCVHLGKWLGNSFFFLVRCFYSG